MSSQYARDNCKIALVKILQTIGWHSINSIPLEVLTDILGHYIVQVAKLTNEYSNEFGQTEPNLDHLGLAFQEMGINVHELEEYVTYVNFVPGANPVPKFPIAKESNLNFLKPGSKEVVTRPVHIYEHLPPMSNFNEVGESEIMTVKNEQPEDGNNENFKKPADVSLPELKKIKKDEEASRPTREISSVMMTTSGFLSPAREGKLPEAKAPMPPPEPPRPTTPTPVLVTETGKRKSDKKKEKISKELFKPLPEEKIKKSAGMKDMVKVKQIKSQSNYPSSNKSASSGIQSQLPLQVLNEIKVSPINHLKPNPKNANFTKALAAAKAKTEKLNTTITPIPMRSEVPLHHNIANNSQPLCVDKLFSEPDKKKVNIFKKISNVKEKHEKVARRDNFPPQQHLFSETDDIVNKINLSSDITIEPIMPNISQQRPRSPERVECIFDDGSPPGTPSTPRTPELVTHSPPILKEKRKRKDKTKVKKIKKQQMLDSDIIDMTMERPKTPEVRNQLPIPQVGQFPFPFAGFGGPGLIPAPLSNPLFPFSQLNFPNFGENPYFPPIMSNIPPSNPPFTPQRIKQEIKQELDITQVAPSSNPSINAAQFDAQLQNVDETSTMSSDSKKSKDHKKEKKDKIKKKNKKDKIKDKEEKKKLKEAKKEKDKVKKEKKEKKKEKESKEGTVIPKMILKVNSPSPRPETPENIRKLNIKPIVKKEEELSPRERKREPSPGLAKISALVTGPPKKTSSPLPPPEKPVEAVSTVTSPRAPGRPRIHPIKQKLVVPKPKKIEQPFVKKDEQGNDIWICPACGQQDDGRPMIGCDGCDAWYHWVCVGIQVPPDENENWYCKPCLCKKDEDLQDKKRKRKKKDKKEH